MKRILLGVVVGILVGNVVRTVPISPWSYSQETPAAASELGLEALSDDGARYVAGQQRLRLKRPAAASVGRHSNAAPVIPHLSAG